MLTLTPSRRAASSLSSIRIGSKLASDIDLINIYKHDQQRPHWTQKQAETDKRNRGARSGRRRPQEERARETMTTAVGELMSAPAVTCTADSTLTEATSVMDSHQIGSVVVTDADTVVGILTERDLMRAAATGADTRGRNRAAMDDRRS